MGKDTTEHGHIGKTIIYASWNAFVVLAPIFAPPRQKAKNASNGENLRKRLREKPTETLATQARLHYGRFEGKRHPTNDFIKLSCLQGRREKNCV